MLATGCFFYHEELFQVLVHQSRLKQIQYIGITDDDLALLHLHQGLFQSIVDEVVDRFYDHVEKIPHLMSIISKWSNI